jgi:hypothetical protein
VFFIVFISIQIKGYIRLFFLLPGFSTKLTVLLIIWAGEFEDKTWIEEQIYDFALIFV